jgi:hypothetical protein
MTQMTTTIIKPVKKKSHIKILQIFDPHRNTQVMVFGQETETAGRGDFQAKDHHECISVPAEITRVWFILCHKTTKKQLLILEFHTPSSP